MSVETDLQNTVTAVNNLTQVVLNEVNNRSASVQAAASSAALTAADRAITQALVTSFQSQFLGSFPNDAAAAAFAAAKSIPLTDGIMYQNTTDDKFRQYNGTTWQNYDSSAQAAQSSSALSAVNAAASAAEAAASVSSTLRNVSSVATLRTIQVSTTRGINLASYYGDGKGGGGEFYGVTGAAAGTYVDNGGTVIIPSVGPQDGSCAWVRTFSPVVSVKAFGAKGNDTDDDTDAIRRAAVYANSMKRQGILSTIFHSGMTLDFESGTYYLAFNTTGNTTEIPIECDVTHSGAGLRVRAGANGYAGTVLRIGLAESFKLLATANMKLPDIYKPAQSAILKDSVGVCIKNLNASTVYFGRIDYFDSAMLFRAINQGTVYCKFFLGQTGYANKIINITPDVGGWCNVNVFHNGNFFMGGVREYGDFHVYMDGTNNAVIDNTFLGNSYEGSGAEYVVYGKNAYNNTWIGTYNETQVIDAASLPERVTSVPVTLSISNNATIFTRNDHRLADGDMLYLSVSGGGSLPTNMIDNSPYYVLNSTANTFQLSQTKSGSVIAAAGTIAATNGSANITGTGTTWSTNGVVAGDNITINGVTYTVSSVTSNTALVLATNYAGSNISGNSYSIYRSTIFGVHLFTIPVASAASPGAVYTNNGSSFTVTEVVSSSSNATKTLKAIRTSGTNDPSGGTLTKSTGTGDASITYSAVINASLGTNVQYARQSRCYFEGTQGTSYRFNVSNVTNIGYGSIYTSNGVSYVVTDVNISGGSGIIKATGASAPSGGTLTKTSGAGDQTISYSAVIPETYRFTISGVGTLNLSVGTTYTNNGSSFVVTKFDLTARTVTAAGTGVPLSSGTLTKANSTDAGDNTIQFSAVVADGATNPLSNNNKFINNGAPSSLGWDIISTGQALNNGFYGSGEFSVSVFNANDYPIYKARNSSAAGGNRPAFAAYPASVDQNNNPNGWATALSEFGLLFQNNGAKAGRVLYNTTLGNLGYQNGTGPLYELASSIRWYAAADTIQSNATFSATKKAGTNSTLTITGLSGTPVVGQTVKSADGVSTYGVISGVTGSPATELSLNIADDLDPTTALPSVATDMKAAFVVPGNSQNAYSFTASKKAGSTNILTLSATPTGQLKAGQVIKRNDNGYLYGTVASISGSEVTLTLASGAALPDASTAMKAQGTANGQLIRALSLTNAAVGDYVVPAITGLLPGGLSLSMARVSAANTIQVMLQNATGEDIEIAGLTMKAMVIKSFV